MQQSGITHPHPASLDAGYPPDNLMPHAVLSTALTVALGVAGAALAWLLQLPAPFLLGPTIVITLAGLAGLKLMIADPLRDACFIIIGLTMGSSATPDALRMAQTWPLSFVLMLVTVLIVFAAAYVLLTRVFRYDRNTAILAAAPGHLSFVLGLGTETGSDVVTIAIIQSIRVLALTLLVPLLVSVLHLQHAAVASAQVPMTWLMLAVALPLSWIAGLGFKHLRLPAAFLLGGAVISTIGHLNELTTGPVPQFLSTPAYMAMGCLIGSRFSGLSLAVLKSAFLAGLAVTALVITLAGTIAYAVALYLQLPLNGVMIAYAPGGLEAMAAMAILMGADSTFVAAHHVVRLLFLTVLMPIVTRDARRNGRSGVV